MQALEYRFGAYRVDLQARVLFRGDERVTLPPKAIDLLIALLERQGRVIDKEELLGAVWPDTFVEEGNLAKNVSLLRKMLGENQAGLPWIETIPKRGYRFIGTMDAAPVPVTFEEHTQHRVVIEETSGSERSWGHWGAAAVALLALVGLAGWALLHGPGIHRTSIAVLPFREIPRTGQSEYLELGIADSLITSLSRIDRLTVRPTSAIRGYASQPVNSLRAGREQQAETVLEGTIQSIADRFRVNVNLLRVRDGASLWAAQLDVKAGDIFALQDEVCRSVSRTLEVRLEPGADARPRTRTAANAAAYDAYLRGKYVFRRELLGQFDFKAAAAYFQSSIDADPRFTPAYAELAFVYTWQGLFAEPERQPELLDRASALLAQAESMDPDLPDIHLVRSEIVWSPARGFRIAEALRELRIAQKIDPHRGNQQLGSLYAHIGLEAQSLEAFRRDAEVDPAGTYTASTYVDGLVCLGLFERAVQEQRRLTNTPGPAIALLLTEGLAATPQSISSPLGLALAGRFAEAEAAALTVLAGRPARYLHHSMSQLAGVYALQGKAREAIAILRRTAELGLPSYPLVERDPSLDRIRKDPEFLRFAEESKARWLSYQREFAR
jgi:DNA-binding winged helix-turn-helix (wHTH) protein/TolB-like protein